MVESFDEFMSHSYQPPVQKPQTRPPIKPRFPVQQDTVSANMQNDLAAMHMKMVSEITLNVYTKLEADMRAEHTALRNQIKLLEERILQMEQMIGIKHQGESASASDIPSIINAETDTQSSDIEEDQMLEKIIAQLELPN